jgi:hypothetical protein
MTSLNDNPVFWRYESGWDCNAIGWDEVIDENAPVRLLPIKFLGIKRTRCNRSSLSTAGR